MHGFGLFYNWYVMSLGFFIPTIIVVGSNSTVFYISAKVSKAYSISFIPIYEMIIYFYLKLTRLFFQQQSQKRITLRLNAASASASNTLNNQDSVRRAATMQRKLTILTLSMTISFYLSWMPYALNCILTMLGVFVPHIPQVIAILFAKSGTVINPILYIFFNKEVSNFDIKYSFHLCP